MHSCLQCRSGNIFSLCPGKREDQISLMLRARNCPMNKSLVVHILYLNLVTARKSSNLIFIHFCHLGSVYGLQGAQGVLALPTALTC